LEEQLHCHIWHCGELFLFTLISRCEIYLRLRPAFDKHHTFEILPGSVDPQPERAEGIA
jgi:hypothetical protein